MFAFVVLDLVSFSVLSQEIGCKERHRNDRFCVGWDLKLSQSVMHNCEFMDAELQPVLYIVLYECAVCVACDNAARCCSGKLLLGSCPRACPFSNSNRCVVVGV